TVYLLAGDAAPDVMAHSAALNTHVRGLPKTAYYAANASSNDGTYMTTQLLDIVPGVYTLCVYPGDYEPNRHPEQAVVRERLVIGADDTNLELVLPPVRSSDPRPRPARTPLARGVGPPARVPGTPPPLPPKRK
ncbi:MAG: hypothetical protein WKG01_10495, partial [Kofleriaceae bacterium]